MMGNVTKFWEALESLSYVQMIEVAEAFRDTFMGTSMDTDAAEDWARLLNSAREAAQSDTV